MVAHASPYHFPTSNICSISSLFHLLFQSQCIIHLDFIYDFLWSFFLPSRVKFNWILVNLRHVSWVDTYTYWVSLQWIQKNYRVRLIEIFSLFVLITHRAIKHTQYTTNVPDPRQQGVSHVATRAVKELEPWEGRHFNHGRQCAFEQESRR